MPRTDLSLKMRSFRTHFFATVFGLVAQAHAACNGEDVLCSRLYSNVTFVGAHDSAFFGPFITQNQNIDVSAQLALGVRFLQAQTHDLFGQIQMCHTSCLELNAGPLSEFLAPVRAFLDGSPDEVVTLLLTNGDAIPVTDFATVFEAAGLTKYVFAPNGTLALNQWPTLQTMIDNGTRLVVWMDYHADAAQVPYILDEFSYYFETPYNETVASHNFTDCVIDRPAGASADGRMGLVNHMLHLEFLGIEVPDEGSSGTTNSPASIKAQSSVCEGLYGRTPNVVLLDYIDKGDAMAAQSALNGI